MRFSRRSEPGAGISARWMASAEPSSKSREIKVLKALMRKPIRRRLITRKMVVPRRIVGCGWGRRNEGVRGGEEVQVRSGKVMKLFLG